MGKLSEDMSKLWSIRSLCRSPGNCPSSAPFRLARFAHRIRRETTRATVLSDSAGPDGATPCLCLREEGLLPEYCSLSICFDMTTTDQRIGRGQAEHSRLPRRTPLNHARGKLKPFTNHSFLELPWHERLESVKMTDGLQSLAMLGSSRKAKRVNTAVRLTGKRACRRGQGRLFAEQDTDHVILAKDQVTHIDYLMVLQACHTGLNIGTDEP